MTLWLRVRRAPAAAFTIVGISAAVLLLGDLSASLPGLFALRGLAVPIALLVPLALSTVLGYGLSAGNPTIESVAARPVARLDACFALLVTLSALGVSALVQISGWSDFGYAAGRNALGYTGLMLIGRRLVGGDAGTLVPAAALLFVAAFGGDDSGRPRWWAWVVAPYADGLSWAFAVGLLLAGSVAALAPRRMLLPGDWSTRSVR